MNRPYPYLEEVAVRIDHMHRAALQARGIESGTAADEAFRRELMEHWPLIRVGIQLLNGDVEDPRGLEVQP